MTDMTIYGRLTGQAIAALSYLARPGVGPATASEIAAQRGISRALVAKILTELSEAGLVAGRPGPGGGYRLARPPAGIRLMDILLVFEMWDAAVICPFGPDWCGKQQPCPLHQPYAELRERMEAYLNQTTLAVFATEAGTAPRQTDQPPP